MHTKKVDAIESALRRDAGVVFVAGASYRGIGIPACFEQAHAVAGGGDRNLSPRDTLMTMRGARTALGGILLAVACIASGCGNDTQLADVVMVTLPAAPVETTTLSTPSSQATVAPASSAPATTAPADTVPATIIETTIAATTVVDTLAPGTVVETLPVPNSPPADTRGQEPVVELGSIEIPKIGLVATMYEGIRLTTLDRGPGHWPGTAMPGQVGNVVVAGHRTSHSRPFRYLELLAVGDEIIFATSEGRFVYHVTSTEIVTPDAIRIVDQTPDATATLFACHPVGSTKQRIVIHLALATV